MSTPTPVPTPEPTPEPTPVPAPEPTPAPAPEPDGDIVAARADIARLKAELEEAKRPKAPAPVRKAPPGEPAPPVVEKKKKGVSRRYFGSGADDD